jgi:hypothetical protein
MSWAARFLFDDPAPALIDGTGMQADPETVARVRARQAQARDSMGDRWLCHPVHRVHRKVQINYEALIANAHAKAQAKNVVRIRRKV